jgi:short-subunit dehydrogenase
MMSAERVAKILVRSIRRKKRNKLVSITAQLAALLQRIVPEQVDWAFYNAMKKEPDSPLRD